MAQNNDRKILRIGIIQNGKIIEERLLRKRDAVTIGQSPRNTFVLPSAQFARSHVLFDLKAGTYQLNFRENMDGRISVEDSVVDFKTIVSRKLAEKKGDFWSMPLSDKSRGKVVVGDVTLLFQFVTPPPPPSRLQLPANVRGGWLHSVDWPFTATLTGSMAIQAALVIIVANMDMPAKPQGIEQLPDRIVQLITQPKPTPKKAEKDVKKDEDKEKAEKEKVEKEKVEEPKPRTVVKPKDVAEDKKVDAPPPVDPSVHREEVKKEVANKTILKFIGTGVAGDGGSIVDTLKNGASDVKVADAFEGATSVAVADNNTAERDRRAARAGASGNVAHLDDSDLAAAGANGAVATGDKAKEVKVSGNVKAAEPSEAFGTGTLDNQKISETVKRRIGAVKSCYEKELKRNPQLQGKIVMQFTIEESGRVSDVSAKSDSIGEPAVSECIKDAIGRWRFDKPEGGSVTIAFPFIFAPAN